MHEKAIKVRQASQNTKEQGFQQRDRTVGLRMSRKKRHKSKASVEQGKEKETFSEKKVHFLEKQSDTSDYEETNEELVWM